VKAWFGRKRTSVKVRGGHAAQSQFLFRARTASILLRRHARLPSPGQGDR
jgi:hypothetical protein